jgi:hypothetical protein
LLGDKNFYKVYNIQQNMKRALFVVFILLVISMSGYVSAEFNCGHKDKLFTASSLTHAKIAKGYDSTYFTGVENAANLNFKCYTGPDRTNVDSLKGFDGLPCDAATRNCIAYYNYEISDPENSQSLSVPTMEYPSVCNVNDGWPTNGIAMLSGTTNAVASVLTTETLAEGGLPLCYGDLGCKAELNTCSSGYTEVFDLYQAKNSEVATFGTADANIKICCKRGATTAKVDCSVTPNALGCTAPEPEPVITATCASKDMIFTGSSMTNAHISKGLFDAYYSAASPSTSNFFCYTGVNPLNTDGAKGFDGLTCDSATKNCDNYSNSDLSTSENEQDKSAQGLPTAFNPYVCKYPAGSQIPDNGVVLISSQNNAHASVFSEENVALGGIPLCYGNLGCNYKTSGSCDAGYTEIFDLYSTTNSHIATAGTSSATTKVCCKKDVKTVPFECDASVPFSEDPSCFCDLNPLDSQCCTIDTPFSEATESCYCSYHSVDDPENCPVPCTEDTPFSEATESCYCSYHSVDDPENCPNNHYTRIETCSHYSDPAFASALDDFDALNNQPNKPQYACQNDPAFANVIPKMISNQDSLAITNCDATGSNCRCAWNTANECSLSWTTTAGCTETAIEGNCENGQRSIHIISTGTGCSDRDVVVPCGLSFAELPFFGGTIWQLIGIILLIALIYYVIIKLSKKKQLKVKGKKRQK